MNGKVHCRIVRAESLDGLFPLLEDYGQVFLICDRNVSGTVGKAVEEGLAALSAKSAESGESVVRPGRNPARHSIRCPVPPRTRLIGTYTFDADEKNKTLSTAEDIISAMLDAGADRSTLVLGVGGGITTDVAGFVASVYMRGVRFAFVPTTLLSQTDAAIGGKNGVNFRSYKNIVGVIRQPEFTYISGSVLRTLPSDSDCAHLSKRGLSGVSEMLKTFIIADAPAYMEAVGRLRRLPAAPVSEHISDLAARAAEIKASIVGKDPFESGLRRVLNLGHTFAHAIEKLSDGGVAHGDAVAVGIVAAARLAERLSGRVKDADGRDFVCEKGLAEKLEGDFSAIGLPTICPYGAEDMAGAMSKDKKSEDGGINFILPVRIGEVRTVKLKTEELETILRESFPDADRQA